MKVLLDTNALLWWQANSKKLSRRAAEEIARADASASAVPESDTSAIGVRW